MKKIIYGISLDQHILRALCFYAETHVGDHVVGHRDAGCAVVASTIIIDATGGICPPVRLSPAAGISPTFSTEGARGGKWLSNQGWGAEGLHYMADCGCCVAGSGAAILGGGCGGRARPRRCRRS